MTNLLLLSSDTGEGHNSAAAAIERSAAAAGMRVLVQKPLEDSGKLNLSLGSLYNFLLTHEPRLISSYFWLLDRIRPNERDICYARVRRYIDRFIRLVEPETVVSVHPMLNHFVQRFIKESGQNIPCYTFVTDPFPPFWRGWASPDVDRYFVVTDEAGQALKEMGIEARRIEQVPMPVRPQFMSVSMQDVDNLRRTLMLDDANTVLINGGARGGGPLLQIYKIVRETDSQCNILVICGRNARLRDRIEKHGDPRTRTFGFVRDIERYVAASDLVITKPGAMSVYEALACRVPVALIGVGGLMTQESGLFHAAKRYGLGYPIRRWSDLEDVIRAGPQNWRQKRESIAAFYKPSTGEQLIERIYPVHV